MLGAEDVARLVQRVGGVCVAEKFQLAPTVEIAAVGVESAPIAKLDMALGDATCELGFAGESGLHCGRPLKRLFRQTVAVHPIIKRGCIIHFERILLCSAKRRGEFRTAQLLEDCELLDLIFDQRSAGLGQRPVRLKRSCPIFLPELQRGERPVGCGGMFLIGCERAEFCFGSGDLCGVVGMRADDGRIAQDKRGLFGGETHGFLVSGLGFRGMILSVEDVAA